MVLGAYGVNLAMEALRACLGVPLGAYNDRRVLMHCSSTNFTPAWRGLAKLDAIRMDKALASHKNFVSIHFYHPEGRPSSTWSACTDGLRQGNSPHSQVCVFSTSAQTTSGSTEHQVRNLGTFAAGSIVALPPVGFQSFGWMVVRGDTADEAEEALTNLLPYVTFQLSDPGDAGGE